MNHPTILGADGKPASLENINKVSAQMSEQHQLQMAEFKQMVQNWERFYTCSSPEAAASTFKGQELLKNGTDQKGINILHKTVRAANDIIHPEQPERSIQMFRVCEAIIAMLSGHPAILNAPETIATLACVSSGAIAIKDKEDEQEN